MDTSQSGYSERLVDLERVWWKQLFDVQAPYRWNLKRLNLGLVLDFGCGVGRNLKNLDGNGVGVDHNLTSIEVCRQRGFRAFSGSEFLESIYAKPNTFDALLLSHVAEHMQMQQCVDIIKSYLPFLKSKAKIVLITPQEAGYRSDSTHVEFMDFKSLRKIEELIGATPVRQFSFPFPRLFGKVFTYNEFNSISQVK